MFALFNFEFAARLWTVMYISLFVLACVALALTLKPERRYLFISVAVLFFFTSFSFLRLLELSQIDMLVASLTVLSLVSQRMKRNLLSAVILSLGILLKGSAIFFLIYFVVFRRDLKYLVYFLVCALVTVGVSLVVVPVQWYWYWIMNVVPTMYSEFGLRDSQSIVSLLWLAGFGKPVLQVVSLFGLGLLTIFALYAGSKRWVKTLRGDTIYADAMFLINGLVILLLSPFSLIYPYVWVILPLALFLSALLMRKPRLWYLALVVFAAFLLNSSPYGFAGEPFRLMFVSISLPTATIGSLILSTSLIPLFVRSTAVSLGVGRGTGE
ncbi:MAG TPA: glycosyltransferase family 87 protein [Candidatus Bathyarchaeia archaeon]|nr:glycosyltransferase family 87 protein [Candidatus Bathyarchaeia archaeon]